MTDVACTNPDCPENGIAKNAEGRLAITRITLRPVITWAGEAPSHETLTRMHEASHRERLERYRELAHLTVGREPDSNTVRAPVTIPMGG